MESVALHQAGILAEAEAAYQFLLEYNPDDSDELHYLGLIAFQKRLYPDAANLIEAAIRINRSVPVFHFNLGNTYKALMQFDSAIDAYLEAIRLDPQFLGRTQHLIASISGNNTERAPIQYVETLFDGHADKFDAHLQQALKYDVPEKLVALVTQYSTPPVEKWNILDLGCGTGLVGLAIAPFARQLVGVDLSAKMLGKAHARKLYQRLERLDLLTMMRGEKTSSYDVIAAADVLIYLGKLDEVISEIKRLLCIGGFFAFSIETLEVLPDEEANQSAQRNYQLEITGRYSHSLNYINRLASANGFLIQEMAAVQIRMERGTPVNGCLILLKSCV